MVWLIFFISVVFSVTGVTTGCKGCTGFHYDGPDGQKHWGKDYAKCAGKHQSPINIDSHHAKKVNLKPLQMRGFGSTIGNASLTNNGHTAMMKIDGGKMTAISGGPLKAEYEFAQLHFHWGANNTVGSEDKIDGKSFPLELHIVFYKKEYLNVDKALSHPDGLTVLACIFEIVKRPNPKYKSIAHLLSKVTKPGQIAVFPKTPALRDFLPNDLKKYFFYQGSLTTPPCSESVTWIDFVRTVKINSQQLAAFRKLVDENGQPLINNFRAIQPLGDRLIRYNKGTPL